MTGREHHDIFSIDDAIRVLTDARRKIGGDAALVACLLGSELEDVGVTELCIVNTGESRYVEIHVEHPAFADGGAIEEFFDSPEQAKKDASLLQFHYLDGVFREFFTTPFMQYAERIGQPFTVVKQLLDAEDVEDCDAGESVYLIRFEDGVEIDAWGHEVCELDYSRCK